MATRFLFQKFPSISRSTSLLRSNASASASVGAQVTRAASVSSIRAITNVSLGAGLRPGMAVSSKNGINACASVDPVEGMKRAFSSDVCSRHIISQKAEMAAWSAELDAKLAACQAQHASFRAKIEAEIADFKKFTTTQACLWGFSCFCWIVGDFLENYASSPHTSSCDN